MHASLTATDSIYSVSTENDVGDRSFSLGKNGSQPDSLRKFTPAQLDQLRSIHEGLSVAWESEAEDCASCWLARGDR
jgi:hypothetical protein